MNTVVKTRVWNNEEGKYDSVSIRVDINLDVLARRLATRAVNSKAGKSTALSGAITGTLVHWNTKEGI